MIRAGSICVSLVYNYFTSSNDDSEITTDDEHSNKVKKLRILNNTFKQYGGVLGKISQLLCINDNTIEVFDDFKPLCSGDTTKSLKKYIESDPKFDVLEIDYNVYKSGSIGQVYKCILKTTNENVVIKYQYEGLYDQVQSDLKILKIIGSVFYSFIDLTDALKDIKTKMNEELSYDLEADNQSIMYDIWKDSDIIYIPKIYTSLCDDKVIVMELMNGLSFNDFLKESVERKKIVAKNITFFVFENIFTHFIFYSDLHYGNFLINNDNTVSVVDYGCIHLLSDILVENLKNIVISLKNDDKDEFFSLLKGMGVLLPKTSQKSIEYSYHYFKIILKPFLTNDDFTFTNEYIDEIDMKDPVLLKEWGLPGELVYFNKVPQGLYRLLWKLNVKMNYSRILTDIFSRKEEN